MKWMKKILIGFVMLAVGGMLLLSAIGLHAGWLIRLIVSLLIIVYGVKKIRRANTKLQKGWGIALFVFGILMLIGAAHLFIGIAIAVLLMYFGLKVMKNESKPHREQAMGAWEGAAATVQEDAFDVEWNKRMNKKV